MSDNRQQRERKFLVALEAYRSDVESGLLFLQANIAANEAALRSQTLRDSLGQAALFWNAMQSGTQQSAIIALGRIFDQKSGHNLDRLLKIASSDREVFEAESLRCRKIETGLDPEAARKYVQEYELDTAGEFRRLRRYSKKYRAIYERKFKPARNRVYAHSDVVEELEVSALFVDADIPTLLRTFAFLSQVHSNLWDLFHNGRKRNLWTPRYPGRLHQGRFPVLSGVAGDLVGRMNRSASHFLLSDLREG